VNEYNFRKKFISQNTIGILFVPKFPGRDEFIGRTVSNLACKYGNEGVIEGLLQKNLFSNNPLSPSKMTPLGWLTIRGDTNSLCKIVAANKFSECLKNTFDSIYSLYKIAIKNNQIGVLRFYLRNSIVFDAEQYSQMLELAQKRGADQACEVLLKYLPSVFKQNQTLFDILIPFIKRGQESAIEIIIRCAKKQGLPDDPGSHSLAYLRAAILTKQPNLNLIEQFLQMGLIKHEKNKSIPDKDTLQAAFDKGRNELIKLLLGEEHFIEYYTGNKTCPHNIFEPFLDPYEDSAILLRALISDILDLSDGFLQKKAIKSFYEALEKEIISYTKKIDGIKELSGFIASSFHIDARVVKFYKGILLTLYCNIRDPDNEDEKNGLLDLIANSYPCSIINPESLVHPFDDIVRQYGDDFDFLIDCFDVGLKIQQINASSFHPILKEDNLELLNLALRAVIFEDKESEKIFLSELLVESIKQKNCLDIKEHLIEKGADPNCVFSDGNTPMHEILMEYHKTEKHKYLTMATQLVQLGANVDVPNNKGTMALHLLCKAANNLEATQLLEFFLSAETINSLDEEGHTPFIYLCQYCSSIDFIKKGLEWRADFTIKSKANKTFVHFLAENTNLEVYDNEFINQQCTPYLFCLDDKGKKPLEIAKQNENTKFILAVSCEFYFRKQELSPDQYLPDPNLSTSVDELDDYWYDLTSYVKLKSFQVDLYSYYIAIAYIQGERMGISFLIKRLTPTQLDEVIACINRDYAKCDQLKLFLSVETIGENLSVSTIQNEIAPPSIDVDITDILNIYREFYPQSEEVEDKNYSKLKNCIDCIIERKPVLGAPLTEELEELEAFYKFMQIIMQHIILFIHSQKDEKVRKNYVKLVAKKCTAACAARWNDELMQFYNLIVGDRTINNFSETLLLMAQQFREEIFDSMESTEVHDRNLLRHHLAKELGIPAPNVFDDPLRRLELEQEIEDYKIENCDTFFRQYSIEALCIRLQNQIAKLTASEWQRDMLIVWVTNNEPADFQCERYNIIKTIVSSMLEENIDKSDISQMLGKVYDIYPVSKEQDLIEAVEEDRTAAYLEYALLYDFPGMTLSLEPLAHILINLGLAEKRV